MVQTTSYGYKTGEDGDKGKTIFDFFNFNFLRLNSHKHDGVDSQKLDSTNIQKISQSLDSADWVAHTNGLFRQLVTLVGGLDYDDITITCKDAATSNQLYLGVEKVTDTTFYVYCNDATKDVNLLYT